MTFSDLLRRFRGDAQRNGPAGEALRQMLASSHLRSWAEEEPPPAQGVRLLLLVATWSRYDLQLLDTLNQRIASPQDVVRLDVASIDDFYQEDFERVLPGIDRVRVEPVLGVWRDGALTERLWGWPAKNRVLELVKP